MNVTEVGQECAMQKVTRNWFAARSKCFGCVDWTAGREMSASQDFRGICIPATALTF